MEGGGVKMKWLRRLRKLRTDDRGQVMVEYLITSLPGFIIAAILYYPGNGLYGVLRARFDITYWLLTFPGP